VSISGMPAFTATSTFRCFASDATTAANNFSVLTAGYTSTTGVTFTGPNTVTDVIRWFCIGY
jgi:expansin (peptidoglycan-binding protein)